MPEEAKLRRIKPKPEPKPKPPKPVEKPVESPVLRPVATPVKKESNNKGAPGYSPTKIQVALKSM